MKIQIYLFGGERVKGFKCFIYVCPHSYPSICPAKSLGVRQIGSFQCLNGKVDLSEHEAAHTLTEWEGQLDKLREELSVRTIAREISAAKVPYTAKVLVYRNSDGRLKPGELIVGSSVPGASITNQS